ncbi:hypothetical protein [Bradyrhizobium japonicum]|nr:hypothetical protein [Bradyrhizobium japonicum]
MSSLGIAVSPSLRREETVLVELLLAFVLLRCEAGHSEVRA